MNESAIEYSRTSGAKQQHNNRIHAVGNSEPNQEMIIYKRITGITLTDGTSKCLKVKIPKIMIKLTDKITTNSEIESQQMAQKEQNKYKSDETPIIQDNSSIPTLASFSKSVSNFRKGPKQISISSDLQKIHTDKISKFTKLKEAISKSKLPYQSNLTNGSITPPKRIQHIFVKNAHENNNNGNRKLVKLLKSNSIDKRISHT